MDHVCYCEDTAAHARCFADDALMDTALPALSDLAFDFELDEQAPESSHKAPRHCSGSTTPSATPLREVRRLEKAISSCDITFHVEALFFHVEPKSQLHDVRCFAPPVGTSIHAHAGATPPPSAFGFGATRCGTA